jgi:hypothetical protein
MSWIVSGVVSCVAIPLIAFRANAFQVDTHGPQSGAPQGVDIWSGVYTTSQAGRGKAVFEVQCFGCHRHDLSGSNRAPSLRGDRFISDWDHTSIFKLFNKVKNDMPPVYSETVSPQSKLDIIAYILQVNGFPSGTSELSPNQDELANIWITRQQKQGIPNFTLVETVGCLEQSSNGFWMLIKAADPAVVNDDLPGVVGATPRLLGTESFHLLSVKEFKPESRARNKVLVRGLLYKDSKENRLNLTDLQVIALECGN